MSKTRTQHTNKHPDCSCCCAIFDSILIKATPQRVFKALTTGTELSHWWPKAAESEPRKGGKLALTWFTGHSMQTQFKIWAPNKKVGYLFYTEQLVFTLVRQKKGTLLKIEHECESNAAIHIAQAWGFLKANLKGWIEHGVDLR